MRLERRVKYCSMWVQVVSRLCICVCTLTKTNTLTKATINTYSSSSAPRLPRTRHGYAGELSSAARVQQNGHLLTSTICLHYSSVLSASSLRHTRPSERRLYTGRAYCTHLPMQPRICWVILRTWYVPGMTYRAPGITRKIEHAALLMRWISTPTLYTRGKSGSFSVLCCSSGLVFVLSHLSLHSRLVELSIRICDCDWYIPRSQHSSSSTAAVSPPITSRCVVFLQFRASTATLIPECRTAGARRPRMGPAIQLQWTTIVVASESGTYVRLYEGTFQNIEFKFQISR